MRYKAVDLFHGIRRDDKKPHKKLENLNFNAFGFHIADLDLVIIKLPMSSWVLKLMTRALLLSLIIVSLPWLNVIVHGQPLSNVKGATTANVDDVDQLGMISTSSNTNQHLPQLLFRDLIKEGLVKMGDRALFLTDAGNDEDVTGYNMDIISVSDFKQQSLIPDEMYDFMFVNDLQPAASNLINRILKKEGIVAIQIGNDPRKTFQKLSNYKIVYLRRFDASTIVGMRKMAVRATFIDDQRGSAAAKGRRLLGLPVEAKKAALSNLEDVLLEPPRAASGKSNRYFKRTRYLPDLIGDSLESYPRRVFIDVGLSGKNDASSSSFSNNDPNWFSKHYPTRNTKFEIYNIETVMEEPTSGRSTSATQVGMSDWLRKNVQENEYVVMKAEAEVVEELVKNRSINLVDELFLECKHRGIKKSSERSRRAYWECLALYGMLRDEGIAVHQWWG
ncbi:hypothetical protein M9H77_32188 [Catharanthus roseus]|uniref:Uncharacterized protein n=1 Tax=Catharanthus roseus TaxID=4058 RepID=A0ACC0A2L7_CATRO|nr:hypothetical protein M9H77_32188 [Catharanthus roseus]